MKETFGSKIIRFYFSLNPAALKLNKGVEILYPYHLPEVRAAVTGYYEKFYSSNNQRVFLIGINPGRYGGGITGIPFTDPVKLKEEAGIDHRFQLKPELSSTFIYEMIAAYGGLKSFAETFYLTALSPLGFTKDGKNYNYYDEPALEQAVRPFIISTMNDQLECGSYRKVAVCLGEGTNRKYITARNNELKWFDEIISLPHPRWIMQYRRKEKDKFVQLYADTLKLIHNKMSA